MKGLDLKEGYVSATHEDFLLAKIKALLDAASCETDGAQGRTRIVRFGYNYDAPHAMGAPIPEWLFWAKDLGDSVTVNEYPKDHGINPHIDSMAFGDRIHILGLGNQARMVFCLTCNRYAVTFPRQALLTMEGEARTQWTHGVEPIIGATRYSIVFRTLRKP